MYRERVNRHCETLGIQIVKANSIFYLPNYACSHEHFFYWRKKNGQNGHRGIFLNSLRKWAKCWKVCEKGENAHFGPNNQSQYVKESKPQQTNKFIYLEFEEYISKISFN